MNVAYFKFKSRSISHNLCQSLNPILLALKRSLELFLLLLGVKEARMLAHFLRIGCESGFDVAALLLVEQGLDIFSGNWCCALYFCIYVLYFGHAYLANGVRTAPCCFLKGILRERNT